ncbi:MAG: NAD kinase [Burkholderiales bacterium]
MNQQFKTIGLIGRPDTPTLADHIKSLMQYLATRDVAVLLEKNTSTQTGIGANTALELKHLCGQVDLVVVMGGDGTMLSAARVVAPFNIPMVGINLGRLGFLTDIPMQDTQAMLGGILDGDYTSEKRLLLNAHVLRGGKQVFSTIALNDVVVSRGAMGSMIEFEVYVDDLFVYNLRSDGLILATPTGSTAYSLSAGGPILNPHLSAFALVPISPHTLSNRPIVLSSESEVTVKLIRGANARVNFDVQSFFDIHDDDEVFVKANDNPIRLIHPKGHSYYAMLREKLHWSEKL